MIVVGGENLIDMVQSDGSGPFPRFDAIPGGAPYNVAIACARQGGQVAYASPVSRDALGETLAARILADGVQLLAERRDEPSSMAVVSLVDGQARYAFYRQGTAERCVTYDGLRAALPDDAKLLMVGGLAISDGEDAAAWAQLYQGAPELGLITALDPNIRPLMISDRDTYMARFEAMLTRTDVLKFSDEDLEWLYPGTQPQQALPMLHSKSSARMIVVTLGDEGALGRVGDETCHVPAGRAAPFADTVGAGDTFMGTLLREVDRSTDSRADLGTLGGAELQAMMARAAQAAAINCSRSGCNPPYESELTV